MAKRSDLPSEISEAAEGAVDRSASASKEMREARRIEAMSLKLAGASYEAIGERLGIAPQSVRALITRNLERADNRLVEEMRAIENARLDRAQAAIWKKVLDGDLDAVRTYLQISARRAKMNGLDAPQRIALSANVRVEMEQALDELKHVVLGEVVDDDGEQLVEREDEG